MVVVCALPFDINVVLPPEVPLGIKPPSLYMSNIELNKFLRKSLDIQNWPKCIKGPIVRPKKNLS